MILCNGCVWERDKYCPFKRCVKYDGFIADERRLRDK